MAYELSNGHMTDDVTWPWKVKLVTPIRLERNILKSTWARDFKFGTQLCMGNVERTQKKFPQKWAWPKSRDAYNFWHMIEHISKTTWARDFKFGTRLCMGHAKLPIERTKRMTFAFVKVRIN